MTLRMTAALAVFAAGLAAQDFDLLDVNLDPNDPAHPGITHEFAPVTNNWTEGAGIAVADFDGDGDDDLFFTGTEGRANELYVNAGDGTFSEAAASHGVDEPQRRRSHGNFLDYDNDGDLDLLTFGYPDLGTVSDLYTLFRNGGAPEHQFVEVTASAGGFVFGPSAETTTVGLSGGSAVADYDNDGFLDVIATYWYHNTPECCAQEDQFRLWHSEPNPVPDDGSAEWSPRIFVDVTQAAGLDALGGEGWIWMPTFVDIDRDGFVDLHVNLEAAEDLLLMNNGDGTFAADIATSVGMNFNGPGPLPNGEWGHEMGAGVADFDNDGDLDFHLTNAGASGPWSGYLHKHDAFYRNDSDLSLTGAGPAFEHIGHASGPSFAEGVGWGVVFADLDNDGDKDLITGRGLGGADDLSNVHGRAANRVWRNEFPAVDENGLVVWTDISEGLAGFTRVGGTLDTMRAVVTLDHDGDGDLDLVCTRSGDTPPAPEDEMQSGFFVNTAVQQGDAPALAVSLVEVGGSLNTIGARVSIRTGGVGGLHQMRELIVGSSWLVQESATLHFGLAGVSEADYVVVRWKDGSVTVHTAATATLAGGFTVVRGDVGPGSLGDLDGDADVDCDDLAFLGDAVLDPAAADQSAPGWPWRLTGDLDGNDLLDGRDFEALRLRIPSIVCDAGAALPGVAGKPGLSLRDAGPGQIELELEHAAPGSTAFVIAGFGTPYFPFKQGLLVPTVDDVIGPLATDGDGGMLLIGPWPSGLPSDLLIQVQVLIADEAAPQGWAFSNGTSIRAP